MYKVIRKLLFQLDPEKSHGIALCAINGGYLLGLNKKFFPLIQHPKEIMGLSFPNSVGLAAGLDKDADYIDALATLGFGFIEVGTITPKPQSGNPKPRLFRLIPEEAIINRMGFNNKGVEHAVTNLKRMSFRGILGINIGKNKDTPVEEAVSDYVICFRRLAPFASYITINVSSPNTQGLRDLQHGDLLEDLLSSLKQEQVAMSRYVPLVVKIAPDLTTDELKATAMIIAEQNIDGVIATNTTLTRVNVASSPYAKEAGGLSGRPLLQRSTEVIRELRGILPANIPIIAAGGIMDAASAQEKIDAGAALVQLYSGFIYKGPALISEIANTLK